MTQKYTTRYGELRLDTKIGFTDYYWEGVFSYKSKVYQTQIEVCVAIFSPKEQISDKTLRFSEGIVAKIDEYLQKAFEFMQKSFVVNPKEYKITQKDLTFLQHPMQEVLWCPNISFYEDDLEWILRFDEGQLSICEPYGVAVFFNEKEVNFIDILDDAEEISDDESL